MVQSQNHILVITVHLILFDLIISTWLLYKFLCVGICACNPSIYLRGYFCLFLLDSMLWVTKIAELAIMPSTTK